MVETTKVRERQVEGRTGHQHVYRSQLLDRSDLHGDDWCDTLLAFLFFFPSSSPHGVYRLHTRGFVHKPVADGKRTHDCIAGGNTLRSRHFFLLGLRSLVRESFSFIIFLIYSIRVGTAFPKRQIDRQGHGVNSLSFTASGLTHTKNLNIMGKKKIGRKSSVLPSDQALLQELQASNDFFDALVDMIPAKLYVSGNSGE